MLFLISSAPTAVPRKYKAFTQKAGITKQFVEASSCASAANCYESRGQKRFPWLLKSEMLQVCFSHLTWEKIRREKKRNAIFFYVFNRVKREKEKKTDASKLLLSPIKNSYM